VSLLGRVLAWSSDSSTLHPIQKKEVFQTAAISIVELAILIKVLEKTPNLKRKHLIALFCILMDKNSYFSLEEMEKLTLLENGELEKVLNSFESQKLLERDGCLYKKPESEKIVEII